MNFGPDVVPVVLDDDLIKEESKEMEVPEAYL